MKRSSKIFTYIFSGLILFVSVWWVGSSAYIAWQGYKWEKQTEEFQLALSKPYREDTYGGKTPEETWGMFLDALKKGDVELASNYIVPEKREEELEFLKKEQAIDNLKLLTEQFSTNMRRDLEVSSDETIYFVYTVKDKKTGVNHANSIVFILNPYTKVWKISLL